MPGHLRAVIPTDQVADFGHTGGIVGRTAAVAVPKRVLKTHAQFSAGLMCGQQTISFRHAKGTDHPVGAAAGPGHGIYKPAQHLGRPVTATMTAQNKEQLQIIG